MVTVNVGKKVIKVIAQCFSSKITDACSIQSADIFARALSSVLLQDSLRYLKKIWRFKYPGVILAMF